MKVNEIFKSIQGESSWQGYPCVFVRLSGCNLRCSWCDTKYAYENGNEMSIDEIINTVGAGLAPAQTIDKATARVAPTLIEITGGEPLLQEEIYELSEKLLDVGANGRSPILLVETNGSIPANRLDSRIIRIIDIKCPGSGMSGKMHWDNLKNLRPTDEIKFVLSDKRDYDWAKDVIKKYGLLGRGNGQPKILFSPANTIHIEPTGRLKPLFQPDGQPQGLPLQIAEWIIQDNLPVRLQMQLHKCIEVR